MKPLPSRTRFASGVLLVLTLPGMVFTPAMAADLYWDGSAGNNNWSDVQNWSTTPGGGSTPGAVPAAADTITFGTLGSGAVSVNLGSDRTVTGVQILTAGGVTFQNANTLTISSTLTGTGPLALKQTQSTAMLPNDPTKTGGITFNVTGDWQPTITNPFGNNPLTLVSGRIWPNSANPSIAVREITCVTAYTSFEGAGWGTGSLRVTALQNATWNQGGWNAPRPVYKYGPAQQTVATGAWNANSAPYAGEFRFTGSSGWCNYIYGDGISTYDYAAGAAAALATPQYFNGGTFRLIGTTSADVTTGDQAGLYLGHATASTIDMQAASPKYVSIYGWGAGDGNAYHRATDASYRGRGAQLNVKTLDGNLTSSSLNRVAIRNTGGGFINTALVGAFVNGTDFIKNANSYWTAFTASDYNGGTLGFNNGSSSENARITAVTTTLGGNQTANAVKLDATGGTVEVALNGNTLTLGGNTTGAAGMILKTGANAASITGGTGTLSTSGGDGATYRDYLIRVNEGTLTLSSIVDMPNTTVMTKSGTGLLILTPASLSNADASDSVAVCEGAIRVDPAALSTVNMQLAGGVFELTANFAASPALGTGAGQVRWNANTGGGFAARGTPISVDLGSGATLSWGLANFVGAGLALKFGSTTADNSLTLTNPMDLGTTAGAMWFREVQVADNTGSTADKAVLSGQITGGNQYHLLKTGSGTLELSNANNTYAGETVVYAGQLNVIGTLSTVAAPAHGTVTVMNGAAVGGTGTINRPVTVKSGGAVSPGASGIGTLNAATGLTLETGAKVSVDIDGLNPCDLANITGNLGYTSSLGGYTVTVSGTIGSATIFTFAQWSGTGPAAGDVTTDWVLKTAVGGVEVGSTFQWDGGGDNATWGSAANWDQSGFIGTVYSTGSALQLKDLSIGDLLPLASSAVIIDTLNAAVAGPTPATTVGSLTLGGSNTGIALTLGAGNMTIAGISDIRSGNSLAVGNANLASGSLSVAGSASVAASRTLSVTGAATVTGSLAVSGTFSAGSLSSSGTVDFNNGATITIPTTTVTGGTTTFNTGNTVTLATAANANGGTLKFNSGTISVPTIAVGASGALEVAAAVSGNTSFSSAGTTTFKSGASGTIPTTAITAGTTTFDSGASVGLTDVTISGSGTAVNFNSGTMNISGATTGLSVSNGTVTFGAGTGGAIARMGVSGGSVSLANQTVKVAVVSSGTVTGYKGLDDSASSLVVYGPSASLATGSGAVVKSADFSDVSTGAATVNASAPNALTIRGNGGPGTLQLNGAIATIDSGNSFTAAGNNLVTGRTLTLSGGILSLTATAVRGTVQVANTSSGSAYALAGGSLIAGLTPSSGSVYTGTAGQLTDGVFQTGTSPSTIWNSTTLTYTLPAQTRGYDLTGIEVYGGWGDSGRENPCYSIWYSLASDPAMFIKLNGSDVNYEGGNSYSRSSITASGGVLASQVAKVQFRFGAQENNYVGYPELQIFGVVAPLVVNLPATSIAATGGASSVLDLGGADTGNQLGGLSLDGSTLTIRNVGTAGNTVTFTGSSVTSAGTSVIALAAGSGAAPALVLAASTITVAAGGQLTLPAVTLSSGSGVTFNGGDGTGTLVLSGTTALSGTLSAGGVLTGTDTVSGSVTVASGGALKAGSTSGAIGVTGNLTLDSGATVRWTDFSEDAGASKVSVGGNLQAAAGVTVDASGCPNGKEIVLFHVTGTIDSDVTSWVVTGAQGRIAIDAGNKTVVLSTRSMGTVITFR